MKAITSKETILPRPDLASIAELTEARREILERAARQGSEQPRMVH